MGRRAKDRQERRALREPRATEVFGPQSPAVLDILEITDWAWYAVYGQDSLSERVVTAIFDCADGDLALFALAAKVALTDYRDVLVWADQVRARSRAAAQAAVDDVPST
jgi:hypothetical protein